MNPEMPQKPQDELEASLTALLLGELPHEQAAVLHQKLAQDAELAKLYERLKHTINLVRETITSPAAETAEQPTPLKLSAQRRQKLLQHFKTVAPKEFAAPRWRPVRWLVPVGIAAALVVILGGLLLPALSRSKSHGSSLAFGTWSLSRQAESAAPAPASERSFGFSLDLNRNGRMEQPVSKVEGRFSGLPAAPPALVPPSPARPAGTAIVLPQGGELADATTTPSVTKGVNAWSASAANQGFYDDSSGRGGVAGGGVTENQQKGRSASDSSVGDPGRIQGLAKPSPPPTDADHFTHRYAYLALPETASAAVEAPPPAVVPPPIAMGAPADTELGKAAHLYSAVPLLAPTEATPADGLPVPRLVLQGITSFQGAKRSIMKVPTAPAASAAAEVLLSPKEHGVAGGGVGAATALAPSGPQDTQSTRQFAAKRSLFLPAKHWPKPGLQHRQEFRYPTATSCQKKPPVESSMRQRRKLRSRLSSARTSRTTGKHWGLIGIRETC